MDKNKFLFFIFLLVCSQNCVLAMGSPEESRKSGLKRKRCDKEKPYVCKVCGIGFSEKGHLTEHMRSKRHLSAVAAMEELPDGSALEYEEVSEPETVESIIDDAVLPYCFVCDKCGEEFDLKEDLNWHEVAWHLLD